MEQESLFTANRELIVKYFDAKSLHKYHKYEEAIVLYETMLLHNDVPISVYIRLCEIYELLAMNEKAIRIYQKGIEAARKNFDKKSEEYLEYSFKKMIDSLK